MNLNGRLTSGLPSLTWAGLCKNTGKSESNAMLCIAIVEYDNRMMLDCGVNTSFQLGILTARLALDLLGRWSPSKAVVSSSCDLKWDFLRFEVQGRVSMSPTSNP